MIRVILPYHLRNLAHVQGEDRAIHEIVRGLL